MGELKGAQGDDSVGIGRAAIRSQVSRGVRETEERKVGTRGGKREKERNV